MLWTAAVEVGHAPVPFVLGLGYLAILIQTDGNGMDQLKVDLKTCLPIALIAGAGVGGVMAIFPAIVMWNTESAGAVVFAAIAMVFVAGIPFAVAMEILGVLVLAIKRNFRTWRRGTVDNDP